MRIRVSRQLVAVLAAVGVVGVVTALTAGCYAGVSEPYVGADFEVGAPPPPLIDEPVVAAPGPEFVWVGGHYNWNVSTKSYAWSRGEWQRPPHAKATWVAPRYEERDGRRIYHAGHWQH